MKSRSECDKEIKFPDLVPTIIATKGLPCTWKSTIAERMGNWARCPVLYIDHFLDALSVEKGYTAEFRPSKEEGDRINRVAIEALWKAAYKHFWYRRGPKCVVVKTSLSSSFELDQVARMINKPVEPGDNTKVIIIDCQMKNEHRYRLRMEKGFNLSEHLEWYKASSWKDIVRAKDAEDSLLDDDHAWDQHIWDIIKLHDKNWIGRSPYLQFVRLVVDAYVDIRHGVTELGSDFRDAIRYLLTRWDINNRYEVVQLGK